MTEMRRLNLETAITLEPGTTAKVRRLLADQPDLLPILALDEMERYEER